jgi:hypothetical protein
MAATLAGMPEVDPGMLVYFETSAWNCLARHPEKEDLLKAFDRNGIQVFSSVIVAGEILRTGDPEIRRTLCGVVTRAHGEIAPLLDHPEYLVRYPVEAWRRGDSASVIRQSPGASMLLRYLQNPDEVKPDERREVELWVNAMHEDHAGVFRALAHIGPRAGPPFCSPEVLARPEFHRLFAEKVPVVAELGLSAGDLGGLAAASDIWRVYLAAAAFTIDAAIDRMPETRRVRAGTRPQKRPGGPDVRQAIYLGVCPIFVLRDDCLQESLTVIAAAAELERHIISPERFFAEILNG